VTLNAVLLDGAEVTEPSIVHFDILGISNRLVPLGKLNYKKY
jgi:hypothetical protein